MDILQHEKQLDSFDANTRSEALGALVQAAQRGEIELPSPGQDLNLHSHTFYSYNAYGYSPSHFAWLARYRGLGAAGIVDFDVLDGLAEFVAAGRLLGLKTCVSLESRVFVPEFSDRVINSPGEPGIAYHMGVGFPRALEHLMLDDMRERAAHRNRELLNRVNAFTDPVQLDYDRDVLPLTPNGNATERHICAAYEAQAESAFPDANERHAYWTDKLGDCPPESGQLQALLRSKTMKRGGVGYVQPGKGSFPLMADMNRFVLEANAIPTLTWLDGTSDGEQSIEELFDVAEASGAAALNIIPDRNYTPGVVDQKLKNLHEVIRLAESRHFPVIVGTEMNSPGNKFVDSFNTGELRPLLPVFWKGAHIVYAHSILQRVAGLGYLSDWARHQFATVSEKNTFYESVGRQLEPSAEDRLNTLTPDLSPDRILNQLN